MTRTLVATTGSLASEHATAARSAGAFERLATFVMFRAAGLGLRAEIAASERVVRLAGAARGRVPTYTTAPELAALGRLAHRVRPGRAGLEIGAYLGAASRYLASGLSRRGGKLYCVDTWNNETMPEGVRDTYQEFRRNLGGLEPWIVPVRKRSEQMVRSDVPEPVGLVFIDGDHSYEACRGDFEIVQQFLAEDAVVAFHDCAAFEGVSRVVGEVLATGRWMLGGHVENLLWLRRAEWPGGGRA